MARFVLAMDFFCYQQKVCCYIINNTFPFLITELQNFH